MQYQVEDNLVTVGAICLGFSKCGSSRHILLLQDAFTGNRQVLHIELQSFSILPRIMNTAPKFAESCGEKNLFIMRINMVGAYPKLTCHMKKASRNSSSLKDAVNQRQPWGLGKSVPSALWGREFQLVNAFYLFYIWYNAMIVLFCGKSDKVAWHYLHFGEFSCICFTTNKPMNRTELLIPLCCSLYRIQDKWRYVLCIAKVSTADI